MTESHVISLLAVLVGGVIIGILATLAYNKLRSGSASPATVKKEMDDYQAKVEAHFDETSKKFKSMAEQYKDLYQHLSVGATSLCRPENIAAELADQSDPLKPTAKLEAQPDAKASPEPSKPSASENKDHGQQASKQNPGKAEQASTKRADNSSSKQTAASKVESGVGSKVESSTATEKVAAEVAKSDSAVAKTQATATQSTAKSKT